MKIKVPISYHQKKRNFFRLNFEYWVFLFAISIASVVPLGISYKIANIFGRLIFIFDRKHRNRVIQHLMHASVAKTRKEAIIIAKKNFIHFAQLVVEIVASHKLLTEKNMPNILSITGPENSKARFFTPGKSAPMIMICAHFGNWEMAGQAYTMASGIPLLSVMRPFDNPKIGEYILGRRAGGTHTVCDKRGALKPMIVALRNGHSVSFLVDQHAKEKEGVLTSFFGHPALTHKSPALLHLKTGVPIVLLMPRRISNDFKFEFIISDPITMTPSKNNDDDVQKLMQIITTETEKVIAKYPEQWLWAHRRWLDINRDESAQM